VTQSVLEQLLCEVAVEGVPVMPHPDMVRRMGAKDALVSIKHLACGLPDTAAYYTVEDFQSQFPASLACGQRVLKQNRGSQGEGIWVCDVENRLPGMEVTGFTMLHLIEAVDNHHETRTLDDFMTFCEQVREGRMPFFPEREPFPLPTHRPARHALPQERLLDDSSR
jgi:hypothetical protein